MSRVSSQIVWLVVAGCLSLAVAGRPSVAQGDAPGDARLPVGSGLTITPDFAQALFEKVAAAREADGCRLARFDTVGSSISIGLQAQSGAVYALDLTGSPAGGEVARRAGAWALSVPAELERDCGATLAAIERVLVNTAPRAEAPGRADRWTSVRANYPLLAATFVLLTLWTARVLCREGKAQPPPTAAVLALVIVWVLALALRLSLSPQTFLHEYYHIAETLAGHLKGETGPVYGDTGPALFQLAGTVFGSDDVRAIFVTNAVVASLAIPAVALLAVAVTGNWPHALCAAVLLCVLPHHLRFSGSEVLFVQAITFGIWASGLFALYVRTRRLEDALCAALALSLAMQTRPEMSFFPVALVALVLSTTPRSWRVLVAPRTLLALLVLGVLFVPRLIELRQVLSSRTSSPPNPPDLPRYLNGLVIFQQQVMPWIYRPLLIAGALWGLWRKPGLVVWTILVFIGYSYLSLSLFDNGPYNLRSQLLPTCFVVLIAAGSAPLWVALWGRHRRPALAIGACLLAGLGAAVVTESRGFVTELRDQQLEWAFLERTVPKLPARGRLLAVAEIGGRNLDAFPQFLLQRDGKSLRLVDVHGVVQGDTPWPPPEEDLLYYQGMYCYFAFPDQPTPDPMTGTCRAVHERYVVEPLFVTDLDTQGYSALVYAPGPYRIGFFRLRERP